MTQVPAELRVMGPIEVGLNGQTHAISGREERVVLSMLVVALDHPVGVGTLVEAIWGDRPPTSASNVVQSVVSRLRTQLVGAAIENVDGAYRLLIDPESVDAYRFEQAVTRANDLLHDDAVEARRAAVCALGLWRGEPYRDLIDHADGALEIHRLTELRARAMELFWESELNLGNHERIVASLEAAVAADPYREHMWYLLIVAMARSGRRVEALRTFDRLSATLADVGMEPTADLRSLPEQILRDEDWLRPRFTPG